MHERLGDLAAAMPEGARGVEHGWALVLEKLAQVLRSHPRPARASA
jgi:hypothetical protein